RDSREARRGGVRDRSERRSEEKEAPLDGAAWRPDSVAVALALRTGRAASTRLATAGGHIRRPRRLARSGLSVRAPRRRISPGHRDNFRHTRHSAWLD